MMFTLSPEQTDLAAVLHDFLGAGRTDLASLGMDEVSDPVDLVVVFEEIGHHSVAGPLIETLAVVPALLAGARAWPEAEAGAGTGVGAGEPGGTWSVAFPPLVPHAPEADRYLLADGTTLHHASPTTTELQSVDPARRLVDLSPGEVIATDAPTEHAFNLGVLTASAQLLGLGRAMLEMTTEYVKTRHQFGKPIGQFQAVKHHLANVLIGLELARPLVHGAAVTLTTRDISAAKVATSDAAWQSARTALQVHGAIGYTAEHDLSRYLLQTRALRTAWGSPSMHRARVLEAL
ncbi:acyl-CoA dehydrogenase family protein [Lentzea sp. NPDC058450]|uniref:acyl-CoA dehydrogenase family protein n=1 Tax=Lentzea sp. NPDC058450 TaxID=3346505 RepID=UPI0036556171